jgi:hypothetical protein
MAVDHYQARIILGHINEADQPETLFVIWDAILTGFGKSNLRKCQKNYGLTDNLIRHE